MGFSHIVTEAANDIRKNKGPLKKALLIPFVLIILLDIIYSFRLNAVFNTIFQIAEFSVYIIISIITHRTILLGPGAIPTWGISKWTFREFYFAAHLVGLGLIGAIVLIPAPVLVPEKLFGYVNVNSAFALLSIFIMLWVFSRLSLVFPAIAADRGVSFKLSWKLTRHHQLLMALIVILYPILLSILALFLSLMLSLSGLPFFFVNILMHLISMLVMVIVVATLSVSFREIYKEHYAWV